MFVMVSTPWNVARWRRHRVQSLERAYPQRLAAPTLLQTGKDGIKRLATSTSCTGILRGSEIRNLIYSIFLQPTKRDICCIQETHLNKDLRFSIRGYESFRADRENTTKGGTLTLVKNTIAATEILKSSEDNTEIIGIKAVLKDITLTVYNTYSPSNKPLQLHGVNPPQENFLIVGDLNSHSPSWGYKDLDQKGEDLEDWMTENFLVLINKPDDPPTYYSRSWRTTSTSDLAMGTDDIAKTCTRKIGEQLGGSDHKPCISHFTEILGAKKRKANLDGTTKRLNGRTSRKI